MKKSLLIMVMFGASLAISACGGDDDTKNNDTNNKGACSTTEYKNSAGDCTALTVCAADEEETTAPTATSDRVCKTTTNECSATEYKNSAGDCTALTVCTADEEETTASTATSDRVCTAKTTNECSATEYKNAAGDCTALTVCTAAEEETTAPTATSDRVCTAKGGCVESTVAGPCDAFCQTGCQANQACSIGPKAGGGFEEVCTPAGNATQDETCNAQTPCAAGYNCLDSGNGTMCLKVCNPNANAQPTCDTGYQCNLSVQGLPDDIAFCGKAPEACTVFPDTCPGTEKCVPLQNGPGCLAEGTMLTDAGGTVVATIGSKAIGEACRPGDCEKSHFCFGATAQAEGKCTALCDPGANPSTCAAAQECNIQIQGQTFGGCGPG